MYKVLFAEDELLVRLGLQNSIPWSKYQMELSALAENGIEAFRLFESIRPDVLITDLRMEGMDGVELVKRVRQIDKDCAIVVVSCMNDFETLRKLIPYNINAYVLKASISIDEVCDALQNVQEYLIRIGRKTDKAESSNDTLETHISKFLLGKIANCTWEKTDFMEYMLLFSLKDEDQTKINALAMEFIYELVRRQLPNKLLIPLKEKEFIIFYEHEERNIDERIKRINSSIEDFLGVRFVITYCNRKESESLKDWFDRAYVQQFNIDYDDNSGKALIQKSIEGRWEKGDDGKPHLTEDTMSMKTDSSRADEWKASGISDSGTDNLVGWDYNDVLPDGGLVNLWNDEDVMKANLTTAEQDLCKQFDIDLPSDLLKKRIEDGTSMDLSDANPTIRMCLEITPKNITRIDSNCIELTENALPGLVQAESDEAFQSAKEALLQQLADAGVEESIEWWQNAWETSKSSIDKLESK